jgi:small subunit ribosomal protein S8
MSQDIVADALNQMMNAVKARKTEVVVEHYSKLFTSILAIAKLRGYVEEYRVENNSLKIKLGKLNGCKAIKPRLLVKSKDIDRYVARYLPARNIGVIVISTSQGLMTHQTAQDKKIGGSLVAYLY